MKNKKFWSVLLFVSPLALGIPLAIYFIPASRIGPQNAVQSHFDKVSTKDDSIEEKLDLIIEKLNQVDLRLKKIEISKTFTVDTLRYSIKDFQSNPQRSNNKKE